jgi:aldose 1-epimerase
LDEVFAHAASGEAIHRFSIAGAGLSAKIIEYGAILQDLRLEGHSDPLVLGYLNLDDYLASANFMGAIVGRHANRIGGARFTLDGERFEVDANSNGMDHLHGGAAGFSQRLWRLVEAGADFVTLGLADTAGSMGFPGSLDVACTYRLKAARTLQVELVARCDRATLCNLAHHSYFNLESGGRSDALDHRLMLPAAAYLPVDDRLIPTGVVQPVDGTMFDFRIGREIRHEIDGVPFGYDHNFCLSAARGEMRLHAWVQAPSGMEMEIWSTEPGLQFYAGAGLGGAAPGLTGAPYRPFSGFCLEPQVWPDSPNRPYFPQAVLRPGETYRQISEYRFRI